ncbi:hypothetical protein F2Q69_00030698 [Brassica cretica]|uniref:Uncharacterized protein n=1 Tax=Brassica cretica TaxID=69181 RepID=A0A8S9S749_BRACR|nr:hypothetical protein F2Q69_00030698 [Brassica cretica]
MESSSARRYYDFDSNMLDDAHTLIKKDALHEHLFDKILFYQSIILSKYGIHNHLISPMGIHPDYLFAHLYRIENTYMPEEVLCFHCKSNGLIIQEVKESRRSQPFFNPHTIYFFHRPVQVNNKTGKIHALPTLIHHNDYQQGVRPDFNLNDNKASYHKVRIKGYKSWICQSCPGAACTGTNRIQATIDPGVGRLKA